LPSKWRGAFLFFPDWFPSEEFNIRNQHGNLAAETIQWKLQSAPAAIAGVNLQAMFIPAVMRKAFRQPRRKESQLVRTQPLGAIHPKPWTF
jgi:hypothetical protein